MNICIENYMKGFEMLDKIYKLCDESSEKEIAQHTRKVVEECNPFPEIFLFFYAVFVFFCFLRSVARLIDSLTLAPHGAEQRKSLWKQFESDDVFFFV